MTMSKPVLMRAKQAAEYLSISKSLFYELIHEGHLPKGTQIRKRCVVWHVKTLDQHAANVTSYNEVSDVK